MIDRIGYRLLVLIADPFSPRFIEKMIPHGHVELALHIFSRFEPELIRPRPAIRQAGIFQVRDEGPPQDIPLHGIGLFPDHLARSAHEPYFEGKMPVRGAGRKKMGRADIRKGEPIAVLSTNMLYLQRPCNSLRVMPTAKKVPSPLAGRAALGPGARGRGRMGAEGVLPLPP